MYGIGRNKQALAGAYAIEGRALIFPKQGIAMGCDLVRQAVVADAEALGVAVFEALEESTPLRKKTLTLGQQTRVFANTMHAFRQEQKAGLRRFSDGLTHVAIRQTPGGIALTPMGPARGRYAFERSGEDQVIEVPASLDAAVVGRALSLMLNR